MSYSLDVNVLLYASNAAVPQHAAARAFLDKCSLEREVLCLTWPTILGYLRISTHPSIFSAPLSQDVAQRNIASLLSLPQVRTISELDGFWDAYREVSRQSSSRGNAVPDTHVATILKQNGVRVLYTSDSDFKRFDFLEVRNPITRR